MNEETRELLEDLAGELRAAISFLEDQSKSKRRRAACLASFRATLARVEEMLWSNAPHEMCGRLHIGASQ